MSKRIFKPYDNEKDSLQIGDLTIENRLDRVSIYGSLDLTLDKPGKENAVALKHILDAIVARLDESPLPEHIAVQPTETVKNPFE